MEEPDKDLLKRFSCRMNLNISSLQDWTLKDHLYNSGCDSIKEMDGV